jgi:hypothetical protein
MTTLIQWRLRLAAYDVYQAFASTWKAIPLITFYGATAHSSGLQQRILGSVNFSYNAMATESRPAKLARSWMRKLDRWHDG